MQQFKLNLEQREALQRAVTEVSETLFQNYFAEDEDWDDRTYAELLAEKPAFQELILHVRRQFLPEAKAEQFFIPAEHLQSLNYQIEVAGRQALRSDHDERPFIDQIVETAAFQELISDVILDAYMTAEEEKEKEKEKGKVQH